MSFELHEVKEGGRQTDLEKKSDDSNEMLEFLHVGELAVGEQGTREGKVREMKTSEREGGGVEVERTNLFPESRGIPMRTFAASSQSSSVSRISASCFRS